jgi:hypothetical protein
MPKAKPKRAARTSPLPSASLPALHLVEVGARYSASKLVSHAHAVLAKLSSYGFASFGFSDAWAAAVLALVTEVEAGAERKGELSGGVVPTADALHEAIRAAKEWRRDAVTVVEVTPSLRGRAAAAGTGSSVAKLCASIRKLLPLVAHPDAKPNGGGAEMKRAGQAAIDAVASAQAAHKKALGVLSPEVRALNQTKGLLYEELRRLARAARRVAPADAASFALRSHVVTPTPGRRRKTVTTPSTPA